MQRCAMTSRPFSKWAKVDLRSTTDTYALVGFVKKMNFGVMYVKRCILYSTFRMDPISLCILYKAGLKCEWCSEIAGKYVRKKDAIETLACIQV